ncbi:hypothetical protein B484DRAFT_397880 [Ochromonadaceae sp. CCMP2298]|nr:hypothetical protein B484DRAFT_397880 [Ochromonadaceae sp. CCMP2298]
MLFFLLLTAFGQCHGVNIQTSLSLRGPEVVLGARMRAPKFSELAGLKPKQLGEVPMLDHSVPVQGQEKVQGQGVHALDATSKGGFVYQEIYSDDSCSSYIGNSGIAVGVCQEEETYSYIVRLGDTDDCTGMKIEYYADQSCVTLVEQGAYDTDYYESCHKTPGGGWGQSLRGLCSTSSSVPEVAAQSYVET